MSVRTGRVDVGATCCAGDASICSEMNDATEKVVGIV